MFSESWIDVEPLVVDKVVAVGDVVMDDLENR